MVFKFLVKNSRLWSAEGARSKVDCADANEVEFPYSFRIDWAKDLDFAQRGVPTEASVLSERVDCGARPASYATAVELGFPAASCFLLPLLGTLIKHGHPKSSPLYIHQPSIALTQ